MGDEMQEWASELPGTAREQQDSSDPIGQLEGRLRQALQRTSAALAMLDGGRVAEARAELAQLVGAAPVPEATPKLQAKGVLGRNPLEEDATAPQDGWEQALPPGPGGPAGFEDEVGDDELEAAFQNAESVTGEMHDANRVAARVLERADLGEEGEAFDADRHPVFATETMAELLEGQGHVAGAHAIREALDVVREPADDRVARVAPDAAGVHSDGASKGAAVIEHVPEPASRARTLATLDRWLDNVRREVA